MPEDDDHLNGWNYGNRLYETHRDDPVWLMREALRRAVDIRDQLPGTSVGARPVMLVDVLNALSDALGFETYAPLWSDWESPPDRT